MTTNNTAVTAEGTAPRGADFLIQNEGSIFLVSPLTAAAAAHIEENVGDEAQFFGGALVVEHRYIGNLVSQLREEGFTVE